MKLKQRNFKRVEARFISQTMRRISVSIDDIFIITVTNAPINKNNGQFDLRFLKESSEPLVGKYIKPKSIIVYAGQLFIPG